MAGMVLRAITGPTAANDLVGAEVHGAVEYIDIL
jgi:hypothetical protein